LAVNANEAKAGGGAIDEPSDNDRETSRLAGTTAATATATGLETGSGGGIAGCGATMWEIGRATG
jgi:hypothetical protein